MSAWRAWVRGLDPPIYVVGLGPPLAGAAATLSSASPLPSWKWGVATAAFLVLHVAVNVFNDAFDAGTPADRFKRHSLARLASVRALLTLAGALTLASAATGLWLWLQVGGWAVFALAAVGMFLLFAYHAPPLRLSHRGFGELVTFCGFGIVPVWTVAALGDGLIPAAAWLPGVWLGLAAALVLLQHNVASRATDVAGGKRTLAVRLGPGLSLAASRVLAVALVLGLAGWMREWAWSLPTMAVLGALGWAADRGMVQSPRWARAAGLGFYAATAGAVVARLCIR